MKKEGEYKLDYVETTTSNYFYVKDINQFKKEIKEMGLAEDFFEPNEDNKYCITCEGMNSYNNETEEEINEDDISELIRRNLRPDQKCFVSQIGQEGYRYFTASMWRIMPYRVTYYDLFNEKSNQYNNGKWIFE